MEKQQEVKVFHLDFSTCTTLNEIYEQIKKELELPAECGRNLNALWDAVTGMMYTPAQIIVSKSTKNKSLEASVQKIISVLQEAEETYKKIVVIINN